MADLTDVDAAQMTKITGASSDGTEQTPVQSTASGRLHTQNRIDPVPGQDVIYTIENVLRNGNKSMDVNGSVTPRDYDYTPPVGEVMYLENISFMFRDVGTMDTTDFGAIAGVLANGVQVLIRSKGTEYEITNIVDNMDVVSSFPSTFTPVSDNAGAIRGMLDEEDVYVGNMFFKTPIKLDNSTGDYVRFRIRDDIRGLNDFESRIKAWRII